MNLHLCLALLKFLPLIFSGFGHTILNTPEIKTNINKEALLIYSQLNAGNLSPVAFEYAYEGFTHIRDKQLLINDSLLTVIDYSLPSSEKRLWVINLKNHRIIENSLVAHGRASGDLFANSFSDIPQSHKSSLGFFITGKTYSGKHGYSLTIDGIEKGINQNARNRSIVFHGANYVSNGYIEKVGRLGRSFGCPALPLEQNQRIIDLIKGSSCIFIYSPDEYYLNSSKLITPRKFSQIAH
jgi:hypothetical protein